MDIDYTSYHRDGDYKKFEPMFRNIFMKRYSTMIRTTVLQKGKVLDIGCSNGTFLDLFKEKGWQTFGVEPSASGSEAEKKSHKISRVYFEKSAFSENYFDLVIMNHTLEHVENADVVLKKINKILKKGGVLYVDVPNAGGLGAKILGNVWPLRLPKEHNYQFTRNLLSGKIKDAGFKIILFESRSGLFEFANPILELWQSLITFKKRFFVNLLLFPYSFFATILNMGDSMSIVARKV